jgi:TIR domain
MHHIKLFISYSHADLKPRPGFEDSRVGRMMADVKHDLCCYSDRSPFKILRDEEITSVSENFRQVIQAAINECDMALVFLSPNFCASEECEAELAQLIEAAKAGKPLFIVDVEPPWLDGDQNRIAKHRNAIKDILFVQFWEWDRNNNLLRFGFPLPDIDTAAMDKYYDAMEKLTKAIKRRAAKLLFMESGTEQEPHLRQTVFMACPTADVKSEAMRLVDALEADNHTVHVFDPDLELHGDASLEDVVSASLAKSDVYVQLLGAIPGRSVPGCNSRLVRAQYDTAKKLGKTFYLWRASGFDIEECQPEYGAFLKDIALVSNLGNYPEFETYLRKKLKDVTAQRESKDRRDKREQAASWPLVAIDAARADRELAEKITSALQDYVDINNLDYNLTAQGLADAVTDSNALVLAYGQSAEGRKRAQAHFKLVRRQRAELASKNLELAVGNGAPPTAPPCPRGPNVHVITVTEKVDAQAMFRFLERLGVSAPQENEAM